MTLDFVTTYNIAADEINAIARDKGWWQADRNEAEMIMLMVTELAEAVEGLRHGNPPSDHIPAFSAVEEELADCIIRIMDYGQAKGYRVAEALVAKVAFNRTRPFMHGGKKF
jgi:NTP pyrophosphatase (non-canonical NTP hydrolase)